MKQQTRNSSVERFTCIRQGRCDSLIQLHLDAGRFQLHSRKIQGFRVGVQPEYFSASMSMFYQDGESAGSAAQIEHSVSIVNARLTQQRFFECSLTSRNPDNGS
jgi:hypothetical protein